MGLSPPPLQRHSALHVIWGLVRVTSPHPVSSPAPRQVQTILGENWKNLFNLQIQDPPRPCSICVLIQKFPFQILASFNHQMLPKLNCPPNKSISMVKLCLATATGSWLLLLPSIKIEIGLGQDKGRQTALKRRSQEIKAFLIVPPWTPDLILRDNCLIALVTIGPRCKGARGASTSNNAPYLLSKVRQRLF